MDHLKIMSKKKKKEEKIVSDSTERMNVYCACLGKQ